MTSRCWAPSWRLRSIRRRSASVAATMRARDARTSASCAPHLGRQALVLEHEPCRRSNGLHEGRLIEQRRVVHERGNLLAPHGHERDRPLRALRELQRPAGSVDVAAIVEAIRDIDGRVAEHPGETLSQARRSVRPQLDDEVGRLRSTQPRPRRVPRRAPSGTSSASQRSIVSIVAEPSPVSGHPGQREQRAEELRLPRRRAAAPARVVRVRAERANGARAARARRARRRCPGFPARDRRRRRPSAAARRRARRASRGARVHADELTAERRQIGACDGDAGGTRPGATLRERQHELDEEGHPGRVEQEAERPQDMRSSPIEDPRRAARMRRRRAGRGIASSASARGRRGKPRREPTTARDPRPRAPRRRRRRLRASRCRDPQPRLQARAAPGRGARSPSARAWRGSTTSPDQGGERRRREPPLRDEAARAAGRDAPAVVLRFARGDEHDDRPAVGRERGCDRESVAVGKLHVEQDGVGRLGCDRGEGFRRRRPLRPRRRSPPLPEAPARRRERARGRRRSAPA